MKSVMTFRLQSQLSRIGGLAQRLRVISDACGCPDETADALEAAVVEAVTNVIKHAYGRHSDQHLKVTVQTRGRKLTVDVFDNGPAWKPDLVAHLAGDSDAETSRTAGLPMIGASADRAIYQRRMGVNRLRLISYLDRGC